MNGAGGENTSIIIPTLRADEEMLEDCLRAVHDTAPQAEVVVVDDGFPFAEHCNLGALRANRSLLVFLNDDTIPEPGWLESLLDPLSTADIGITGAKLLYPDRSIAHAGVYLDAPDGILTAHNILTDEPSRDVDAVTGACLAITRPLFNDCTGFDPGFVNGYEDVDLCLRVRAGGWRVRYVAESVVVHLESRSGERRWTHVAANIQRLQELWSVSERATG